MMMESTAISAESLTSGFSPSAVRTLTGLAAGQASAAQQMSQYQHHHHHSSQCSPYSGLFNVSSVLAEHLNATRVGSAFGISPATAMLHSHHHRIPAPDPTHHQSHHQSMLSSLTEGMTPLNANVLAAAMSADLSSPAPSTDGDSNGEHYHTEDSITSAPEDNKLFTLKRAIQAQAHYVGAGGKGLDPSFAAKEQENSLMNGNKNRCNASPKKHRLGKTVSAIRG